MAIKKPIEMDFSNKKFMAVISGQPGLGKTTLALSAPNPILFDLDKGVGRIKAEHRCIASESDSYEEMLSDMESDEYKTAESVVIDTGGSLVQLMQPWAKKQDPKAARDGRAMFGVIKREFDRLVWQIRNDNKNLVIVFHTTEIQKGDIVTTRISCEGSAKDIVWTPADIGGYMYMQGGKRMIGFTPTEEYFAKGCFGVSGLWEVPDLSTGKANTFLADLFSLAREKMSKEMEKYTENKAKYDVVMKTGREIVAKISDAVTATEATKKIGDLEFALTARYELLQELSNKTNILGLVWNKETKKYEKH